MFLSEQYKAENLGKGIRISSIQMIEIDQGAHMFSGL
jgi:hypothetical protein